MPVVDASIVVRLLQNRRADGALRERFGMERRLHAPALIDAEVASAVRGLAMSIRGSLVAPERAQEMLDDYAALPIVRHAMQPLMKRVHALRHNLTAYDAFYVALAQGLDLPLLTDDHKIAGAPSLPISIETWPS